MKKDRRLGIVGVPGGIKAVWHRNLPDDATVATAILTRQLGKWYVVFSVDAAFAETCGTGTVGIDLGLNSLCHQRWRDDPAPRYARRAQAAQRRRQRPVGRCRIGSKRRLKAKTRLAASAKIAHQRGDYLHKLSRALVSRYRGLAFEDLNFVGLKRGMLARSIHDAAWACRSDLLAQRPLQWLMQKAERHRLAFRGTIDPSADMLHAAISDSFREFAWGLYAKAKLNRPFYRTIGEPPRPFPGGHDDIVNETIDASVFDRWRADATYRPRNLADWARRHGIDPSALTRPVLTHEPSQEVQA